MADAIQRVRVTTKAGNVLELFYNADTNLVVLDLATDAGGNELLRRKIDEAALLAHLEGVTLDDEDDNFDHGA